MFSQVDTKDTASVENEIQTIYLSLFPDADPLFIPRVFFWALDCFTGHYGNYLPIDARYHDLEHTLQGTLCMARILLGRYQAGVEPDVDEEIFRLGLFAILLHDTGYLKERSDKVGTGAKYTLTHVSRSVEFAARFLADKGYTPRQIQSVQNMIRCTGVNVDLSSIPFQSEAEKIVGFALGTGDLLGQMAADDYVEKLPILYQEFAESQEYNKGAVSSRAMFASAEDLMRKTPLFWTKYVVPKINDDFLGLYRFLHHPYPHGPNFYLEKIQANIDAIEHKLSALPS